MKPIVVVDVSRLRYTRYEGRKLTHQFLMASPLSAHWVEEIRNDPEQFGKVQGDAPEAAET